MLATCVSRRIRVAQSGAIFLCFCLVGAVVANHDNNDEIHFALHRVTWEGDQAVTPWNLDAAENSNIFLVYANNHDSDDAQGFIVDAGKYPFQAQSAIHQWKALVSSTVPPRFLWLTHAHPDHWGGLYLFKQEWPTLKAHVGSQKILDELSVFLTSSNFGTCPPISQSDPAGSCLRLSPMASPNNFNYNGNITIAQQSDLDVVPRLGRISVWDVPRVTETEWANLLYMVDANVLFPGDLIGIRAHKYTSLFVSPYNSYPGNDQVLCGWIDAMSQVACSFPEDVEVAAGHGPVSSAYGKSLAVITAENIAWLQDYRQLVSTSCDAQYVWNQLKAKYPSYGDTDYLLFFGSFSHVPNTANALGCGCSGSDSDNPGVFVGTPQVCSVGQPLPACRFSTGSALQSSSCAGGLQAALAAAKESSHSGDHEGDHTTAILGLASTSLVLLIIVLVLAIVVVMHRMRDRVPMRTEFKNPIGQAP